MCTCKCVCLQVCVENIFLLHLFMGLWLNKVTFITQHFLEFHQCKLSNKIKKLIRKGKCLINNYILKTIWKCDFSLLRTNYQCLALCYSFSLIPEFSIELEMLYYYALSSKKERNIRKEISGESDKNTWNKWLKNRQGCNEFLSTFLPWRCIYK